MTAPMRVVMAGGGTGGHSARGVPSIGPDGKFMACEGTTIAMSRSSQSMSIFICACAFSTLAPGCRKTLTMPLPAND